MALREIVIRGIVISILSQITFGIVFLVAALMIFSQYHRTLWDRWSRTVVVTDQEGTYDPALRPAPASGSP